MPSQREEMKKEWQVALKLQGICVVHKGGKLLIIFHHLLSLVHWLSLSNQNQNNQVLL